MCVCLSSFVGGLCLCKCECVVFGEGCTLYVFIVRCLCVGGLCLCRCECVSVCGVQGGLHSLCLLSGVCVGGGGVCVCVGVCV